MDVTEIRIKLAGVRDEKLLAYCSITFDDCFVVRDLKIIKGNKGMFVAMPSRKLTDLCPGCGSKNHFRARYCNECGHALAPERAERDELGRSKLHADIAHPIHAAYREELQRHILEAYEEELRRARQPGYEPPREDFLDLGAGTDGFPEEFVEETAEEPQGQQPESDRGPHTFGEGILP